MATLQLYPATATEPVHKIVVEGDHFNFDAESPEFQAFKEAVLSCNPKYRIHVVIDPNLVDFKQFSNCIDFLKAQGTAYYVSFVAKTAEPLPKAQEDQNRLLTDVYAHLARKQSQKPLVVEAQATTRQSCEKKIRRAKQLINRNQVIRVQTQQEHHQHKEHATQAVQQQQQVVQQQMAETRANQIQQQQQRLLQRNQYHFAVDDASLGMLIHEGNLDQLVTPTFPLEKARALWFNLVGKHASKVDDPSNRITHVPKATLRLIAEHPEQFSDGIHFEDLPNGFGFIVRETGQAGQEKPQSILYYDKKLEEKSDDLRRDSFLAARLVPKKTYEWFNSVGQFYPFSASSPFHEAAYQAFIQENQAAFDQLLGFETNSLEKRIQALIQFLLLDEPSVPQQFDAVNALVSSIMGSMAKALNQSLAKGWEDEFIAGLRGILLEKGADGLLIFLAKLNELSTAGLLAECYSLFMKDSIDYRDLVSSESTRKDELSALASIDYLLTMPPEQRTWWQSMTGQHAKANRGPFDLVDLVNAHRYFFNQVKVIDPALHLPQPCPMEHVVEMKVTYARLLYVLRKAIDPIEQSRHLQKLDWGMQGVICGASRGPYCLVAHEMNLTPDISEFDIEKLRPYRPDELLDWDSWVPDPLIWGLEKLLGVKPYLGDLRPFMRNEPFYFPSAAKQEDATRLYFNGLGLNPRGLLGIQHVEVWKFNSYDPDAPILSSDSEVHHHKNGFIRIPGDVEETVVSEYGVNKSSGSMWLRFVKTYVSPNIIPDEIQAEFQRFRKKPKSLPYNMGKSVLYTRLDSEVAFSDGLFYFYRFIGTEVFRFPFTQYLELSAVLAKTRLSCEEDPNNEIKKYILLFLATGTTGTRALKQERNLQSDLEKLIHLVSKRPHAKEESAGSPSIFTEEQQIGLLKTLRLALLFASIEPTLHEMTALLSLTHNKDRIQQFITSAQKHGAVVYCLIVYLSLRSDIDNAQTLQASIDFLSVLPDDLNPTQKNTLILLAGIMATDHWSCLKGLIQALQNTPDEILTHLESFLHRVSIPDSTGWISVDDAQLLFKKINGLQRDDTKLSTMVLGHLCQTFPTIKFHDETVAHAMAYFICGMQPFVNALDGLLTMVGELRYESTTIEWMDHYLSKIDAFINGFKEKLSPELVELKRLIEIVTSTEKTETMVDVLKKMQDIVFIVEHATDDFTLGSNPKDLMLAGVVKNIIGTVQKKLFDTIADQITNTVKLQLMDSLLRLNINDAVLDKDSEKGMKLSVAFKDFIVAQLPSLPRRELVTEINAVFAKQEVLDRLIKRLKQVGDASRRDRLIALLYRQGYFKNPTVFFSIEELTDCMGCFIGHPTINLERAFHTLLQARVEGISVGFIQSQLTVLSKQMALFSDSDFQTLLACSMKAGFPLNEFIDLQTVFRVTPSKKTALNFSMLLEAAATKDIKTLLQALCRLLKRAPEHALLLADFINESLADKDQGIASIGFLLKALNEPSHEASQLAILTVLQGACWTKAEEKSIPVARQWNLIEKIMVDPSAMDKLKILYERRPSPGFTMLEKAVNTTPCDIEAFIEAYQFDPFGKRAQMKICCNLVGVDSFLSEIKYLLTNTPLEPEKQNQLKQYLSYILGIGLSYGLPVGEQLKPLCQFQPVELKDYYHQCIRRTRSDPADVSAKLEGLAVLCEVMFRATGKYPYPSQIISVLNTIIFNDSLLLQIPTGQGKSLIFALMAVMAYSFTGGKKHVTVCSRTKLLTGRDYQESLDFFNYLDIPIALVSASTDENYYEAPTIVYSTPADKSLYDSKLKVVHNITFPPKRERVVLCDEADAEFFDNKNDFNFSEGNEDPYVNPLEWLYPHVNAFIKTPGFKNEYFSEMDDVGNLRSFLQEKNKTKYDESFDRLTDFKLSQLLDAACAAQQLVEKTHFLVRQKTRDVHGKTQTISEAHVLDLISHAEDTEATLSHGVQQCLHARLAETYASEVTAYETTQGREGNPPFSCDNQIDCVDSQNASSFFKHHGRIIGATGTAGTIEELQQLRVVLGIECLLDIPPRKRGQLEYLPTVFSDPKASFFFGNKTQEGAIIATIGKDRRKPVLISCENIHKSEELYQRLKAEFGTSVQIIHAENASDPNVFQACVDRAKAPGMITITTPLAARGVDIKTTEELLVIETVLDRYRNRKQLQGRTARDSKSGQTIGIFDVEEIAKQYGMDLQPLTRTDKLKALERIMTKMDKEACFERGVMQEIHAIFQHYQGKFDDQISRAMEQNQPPIIAAKAEFIEEFHQLWQAHLAESDPKGEHPNPYLRYRADKTLDDSTIRALIERFKCSLENDVFSRYRGRLSLDNFDPMPTESDQPFQPAAHPVPPLAPGVEMPEVYRTFCPKEAGLESYKDHLQFKQTVDERIDFWILNNRKADASVKDFALSQRPVVLDGLIPNGKPVSHYCLSALSALTRATSTLTPKILGPYLKLHALALTDACYKHHKALSLDTEKEISKALFCFLKEALAIFQVKNKEDRNKIQALFNELKSLGDSGAVNDFKGLQCVLLAIFKKPDYKLKSASARDYLTSIQQTIHAVTYSPAPVVNSTEEAYLQCLTKIGERLKQRADNAGFWKDKALYDAKQARFAEYLQQVTGLINNRKANGIEDLQHEIRALEHRMEQDAVIHTSTARFFKIARNVTVIKEIRAASKAYIQ